MKLIISGDVWCRICSFLFDTCIGWLEQQHYLHAQLVQFTDSRVSKIVSVPLCSTPRDYKPLSGGKKLKITVQRLRVIAKKWGGYSLYLVNRTLYRAKTHQSANKTIKLPGLRTFCVKMFSQPSWHYRERQDWFYKNTVKHGVKF